MKIARKIVLSLAAVLLFVLCFLSFVFSLNHWFVADGRSLNDEETKIISQALGFDIAPGEGFYLNFDHGFWPGSISRLWGDVEVASEEEYLSRCHEETAFELHSYNYAEKDFYHAEVDVGRDSGLITKELERMLNDKDRWQPYVLPFVGFCVGLVGKAALSAIAIAERVKRRKAKKAKSNAGVDDAAHAIRGPGKLLRVVVRVLAVALVPVMTVLTGFFLGPLMDGGDLMLMRAALDDSQQKELSRRLGFELAPGESLEPYFYEYRYFTADEMHVRVHGILSEDEFLARFPNAVNVKTQWNPWDRYALCGNSDIILEFGRQTEFHIAGRAGRPALRYGKKIIIAHGSAQDRFDLAQPYMIVFGWLADFALIIVPIVMQGKAKKEKANAEAEGDVA